MGNSYKVVDAEGKQTVKEFDPFQRVTKITYADETFTEISYGLNHFVKLEQFDAVK